MSGYNSGGTICSVATCESNAKRKKETGESISFHRFPKDLHLRKEWIRRCYRKDVFNPENKRICSRHFHKEDFEDLCRAKIMNVAPKKLKSTAIPCLNLKYTSTSCSCSLKTTPSTSTSSRIQRATRKKQTQIVRELLESKPPVEQVQPSQSLEASADELSQTEMEFGSENQNGNVDLCQNEKHVCKYIQSQCNSLKVENEALKKELERMKNENSILLNKNKQLEMSILHLQTNFENRAKEVFSSILSPNQIDILLKKKSKARWTSTEISKAFTIRYFSIRCYLYLRNKLKYPLPGISTLQKWASTICLRNGKLPDILKIMEVTGETTSAFDKLTVLCFDEVKIASLFEYDEKEDEVVGPYQYMQVVMARGLCAKWKQPVYINFDTKVTKGLLFDIVTGLHNIKYEVVACVSDCGGSNMGLWNTLNININNTSVFHPITHNKIYFFADVPHLLKLIRSWFIDKGFILSNGNKVINKQPFCDLLNMSNTEISSCYKLTPLHLNCEKVHRQNVALAAQLFSNTSATALKRYLPGCDKKLAKDVGDFVELVGQWFDIMNSYTPSASIPTKKPYGKKLTEQDDILNRMKDTFQHMLCMSKASLQIFQKGVIVSTTSLQELYKDLKERHDISYLLTHRLNQDCLENLFSQMRSKGGLHDHPSPLNALYRIRMILLGKNPGVVQAHTNFMENPDDKSTEFILAEALKTAKISRPEVGKPKSMGNNEETDSSIASSTSSNTSTIETNVCEEDGLQYIAGFLARKYRKEYPSLGRYTHELEESNVHTYTLASLPSWIQSLSFGGLTEPSKIFQSQVTEMEKYFKKIHKNDFKRVKNVVYRSALFISKKMPEIPMCLIKSFVKLRIFMRIKYLNVQKKSNSILGKRKAENDDNRKTVHKMRRIVN